jgi:hypothetical protein
MKECDVTRRSRAGTKKKKECGSISEGDRVALKRVASRFASENAVPGFTTEEGAPDRLVADHPEPHIGALLNMNALGIANLHQYSALVGQIISVAPDQSVQAINETFALVTGVGPRDPIEAMLALQMAAVHNATLVVGRRLRSSNNVVEQDSCSSAFNKLARTFVSQVDTLKRYRSKGEQRVVVEHQHVEVFPGGQAVIGAFSNGGGAHQHIQDQSHERDGLRIPESDTVLGHVEADAVQVSRPSAEGKAGLPLPRRHGRRTGRTS